MDKELGIENLITNAGKHYVENEYQKGRVPSDWDIGDYLDHWLEKYERQHGDIIDEDNFEALCDKLGRQFINEGLAYKRGDQDSYIAVVRSKGFISYQEHAMHKNITSNKNCRIVFRDTEFPIDINGYYIINQ